VAEFTVEADTFSVGDKMLITGPTTGALYVTVDEIHDDTSAVETAQQGTRVSFRVPEKVRPSDKLFKIIPATMLLFAVMLFSLPASAGGGIPGIIKKVGAFIDTLAIKGVDPNYLEIPEKPWQVVLKGNVNQSDLKLNSTIHHAEDYFSYVKGDMTWEPRVKTDPATYVGVWGAYRGYGLGYSWNVGGDDGRLLTFGLSGGCYGLNLRIHWFDNDNPEVNFSANVLHNITNEGGIVYEPFAYSEHMKLSSPINTRDFYLDGYYLFNSKKCSYAAAYDQSAIQRRSAGSLIAGAMYFHSTTRYNTDNNADLILLMDDIGVIKSWEGSLGLGYIYNWVPVRGLMISGMAIPMLTVYNHHKWWCYDSNLKDLIDKEGFDAIGTMSRAEYRIRPSKDHPEECDDSPVRLNFDARLSITYELDHLFYVNAYGQFNSFRYKVSDIDCKLNEWYINASIGIRL
jgi:hypothetical protein